jgi:UDP-N-acetylglucosamine 2-epimerase (non-hydrolysing)
MLTGGMPPARPNKAFRKRVLAVFGTRPEAIKLAPVIRALDGHPQIETVVCVTGQHRGLLDQVLDTFHLTPDYDLNLLRPEQTLSGIATRIVDGVDRILGEVSPELVLVHGDTATCFGASLAAFYRRIPIGHVEAGLRTWDMSAPFPEEAHRAMVGRISTLHFAPTEQARKNLLREGIEGFRIHVTGNTVIDALLIAKDVLKGMPAAAFAHLFAAELMDSLSNPDAKIVLVTAHRRENLDNGLDVVASAIAELARRHGNWRFVYLLHANPAARRAPMAVLAGLSNVSLVEPLGYLPFIRLMLRADAVLTDSGGLQEEASELNKPLLIMRDVTERPEAVRHGIARLVGTDRERIVAGVEQTLLGGSLKRTRRPLYGDGRASEKIVAILAETLLPKRGANHPLAERRPADESAATRKAARTLAVLDSGRP